MLRFRFWKPFFKKGSRYGALNKEYVSEITGRWKWRFFGEPFPSSFNEMTGNF
jgi:hypothetical protein